MVKVILHCGQYSITAEHNVNGLTKSPTWLKANFQYNNNLVPEMTAALMRNKLLEVTNYLDDNFTPTSTFKYEQVIYDNGPLTFKTVDNYVGQ